MKTLIAAATALCAAFALPASSQAQETFDLTVASFVPEPHGMSQWIERWAAGLTERSGGRLQFEILHGAQMGPPPRYYDIAANGQADITWVLHGATPGRFQLTEVSNMPFLFCSAEQATLVLNDPEIRSTYLDAEHRGVKVLALFMHPPGQIIINGSAVTSVSDLAGKALRPASQAVGQLIAAMGARPVGLPPTEMAEGLQRGTIDGAMIDYGGAALAFGLGPFLTDITEVYAYSASFGLVMNEDSFAGLPDDLKAMIDESVADVSAEIGKVWDGMDGIGKQRLMDEGVTISEMGASEMEEFRTIAAGVTTAYLAALEEQGLPGEELIAALRARAEAVGPVGLGCQ